jgi:hypothetical protein
MALGSIQSMIETSTRNLAGGEGRPSLKDDNLTAICEPIVLKNVGASTSLNTTGLQGLFVIWIILPYIKNRLQSPKVLTPFLTQHALNQCTHNNTLQ